MPSLDSHDVSVHVGMVPIPDGVTSAGTGADRLRVSLFMSPHPEHGPEVELADWPGRVWELCRSLTVNFEHSGSTSSVGSGAVSVQPAMGAAAGTLWRRMFGTNGQFEPADLARLKNAMLPSRDDTTKSAAHAVRTRGYNRIIESATTSYQSSTIVDVFGGLRDAVFSATLRTRMLANALPDLRPGSKNAADGTNTTRMYAEHTAPFLQGYARTLMNILSGSIATMDPTLHYVLYDELGQPALRFTVRQLTEVIAQHRLTDKVGRMTVTTDGPLASLGAQVKAVLPAMRNFSGAHEPEARAAIQDMAERLLTLDTRSIAGVPMVRPEAAAKRGDAVVDENFKLGLLVALAIDQFEYAFGEARGTLRRRTEAEAEVRQIRKTAVSPEEQERLRLQDIKARYATVRSYPTLGKAMGFIVDIEIDPARIAWTEDDSDGVHHGYLSVRFGDAAASLSARVAFRYHEQTVKQENGKFETKRAFRPAASCEILACTDESPSTGRSLPLMHGMVDLTDTRFSLSVVDVHSAVNANKVHMFEYAEARKNSDDDAAASLRIVEERGRGIQLLDGAAAKTVAALFAQLNARGDAARAILQAPLYAEDLILGYRVLVQGYRLDGGVKPWRSLMARTVKYEGIAVQYGQWRPGHDLPERDHAYLRPLPRIEQIEGATDDAPDGRPVAPSVLFSWLGSSLGLPPPETPRSGRSSEIEAERRHVGLGVTISEADPRAYPIPALRCGWSYRFALAPVYMHGGGPTVADFASLGKDQVDAVAVGEKSKEKGPCKPFRYGPPNDIDAPRLLIGPDDPLAGRPGQAPNETYERLVVRSGAHQDRIRVRRFFLPPRVDFDRAEQFGVFDRDSSRRPRGAFEKYRRDCDSGDFPVLELREGQPGAPLLMQGAQCAPKHAYYPDPLARNLSLAFERNGAPAPGFPAFSPPRAFWQALPGESNACLQARPIELEVQRGSGNDGSNFVDEDTARPKRRDRRVHPSSKLVFALAPAEEVTVWAWCWPDLAMLIRARPNVGVLIDRAWTRHKELMSVLGKADREADDLDRSLSMGDYLAAIARGTDAVEEIEKQLAGKAGNAGLAQHLAGRRAMLEKLLFWHYPTSGVNGWRKFHLVHAVALPRSVPDAARVTAVRLLPETVLERWPQVGSPWTGQDQLHGTSIYLGGAVGFDRASTRAIRIDANWPMLDHAQAIVGEQRADGTTVYHDRPPRRDQTLAEIIDIPRNGDPNLLNLQTDEQGRLRALLVKASSTGTSATAARRMDIRVIASSRFRDDFAPGPATNFELASRAPVSSAMTVSGEMISAVSILLPATARPPLPVVTQIEWVMPEQSWEFGCDHTITRKSSVPRLYLDNSWRTSGENELLAVMFERQEGLPDIAFDASDPRAQSPRAGELEVASRLDRCDKDGRHIAAELARMARAADAYEEQSVPVSDRDIREVTRWGADPVAKPGHTLEWSISPLRFSGFHARLASVNVPKPGTASDAPYTVAGFSAVTVLLFKPQLEASTGRWYVDIGIDPGLVPTPFVRLALARYQPNALKRLPDNPDVSPLPPDAVDLHLSPVLLLDPMRIPSPRLVEVHHERLGELRRVTATVFGAGYVKREPYGAGQLARAMVDTPVQNFELMRMCQRGPRAPLRVFDLYGQPMMRRHVRPLEPARDPGSSGRASWLAWRCSFDLPVLRSADRFEIVINEVDLHVPDEVIDAGVPDPEPAQLVERPAFFSLTVAVANAS